MVHLCVPRSATAIDAFTPTVYALRPTIYPHAHAHAHGPNDDHSSRPVSRVKRARNVEEPRDFLLPPNPVFANA